MAVGWTDVAVGAVVGVEVGAAVGVDVGALVAVAAGVGVEVATTVGVGVAVTVEAGVAVGVAVAPGVLVGGAIVGVAVLGPGVGVGCATTSMRSSVTGVLPDTLATRRIERTPLPVRATAPWLPEASLTEPTGAPSWATLSDPALPAAYHSTTLAASVSTRNSTSAPSTSVA